LRLSLTTSIQKPGLHSLGSPSGHSRQQHRVRPSARVVAGRNPADQASAHAVPVTAGRGTAHARVAAPARPEPGLHLGAHRADTAAYQAGSLRGRCG
jgi:hypothetical protein